jgi:beta-lactam-binding protein with PASTA domain
MRMRRHTEPLLGPWRGGPAARFARDLGLVALVFVIGYFGSSYWIAPRSGGSGGAVPRVLGRSAEQARTALAQRGFRIRIEGERSSSSVPRGAVVWQDPPPATTMPLNATVQLILSAGPAPVTVPDVVGFSLPTARQVIEAAGARVGRVDTVRGGDPEAGVVIATRPTSGNGRPRGAPVDLVVSGPPAGTP